MAIPPTTPAQIQAVRADLNVVLRPDQINQIVRQVIGERGQNLGGLVALASDHCCVDASVGSSVAGPVSSVASSVSTPDPGVLLRTHEVAVAGEDLRQSQHQVNVGVTMPGNLTVR